MNPQVAGRHSRRGVGHNHDTAIRQRLDREALQTPALLGGRREAQQAKGQIEPGLSRCGRDLQQQVAAAFTLEGGDGLKRRLKLGITELAGRRRQGHLRPAEHLRAPGMGQQGAGQHQPVGLRQLLPLAIEQAPGAARAGH